MIDGIGTGGTGRVEPQRVGVERAAAAARTGQVASQAPGAAAGGVLADLLGAGPPVDSDKVSAIRAAIAEGRYAVDPDRIAERMVETDLAR